MIRLFYILFAAACIGSMFVYSHQFTDAYIVPKWCCVLFVLLWMLVCAAFLALQRKSIVTDMGEYHCFQLLVAGCLWNIAIRRFIFFSCNLPCDW